MTPGESANAEAELELARQALRAAAVLRDDGALHDAISRAYYATFHAARATLTVRGLYSKTHGGLVTLFSQTYGESAALSSLLEQRGYADYDIEKFHLSKDDVARHIGAAEAFVARCGAIVGRAVARGPDEPDPPADL